MMFASEETNTSEKCDMYFKTLSLIKKAKIQNVDQIMLTKELCKSGANDMVQ